MKNVLTGVKGVGLTMIAAGAAITGHPYSERLAGAGLLLSVGTSQIETLAHELRRPKVKVAATANNAPKPGPQAF